MYVRLFAILFILSTCIPNVVGNTVVSNSVSSAAGSVAYSISYSDTAGSLTHKPTESISANDNVIVVGITGCSIQGADQINGQLSANDAGGDKASVTADITGPGASVTNYDLFGYVTPNLAWAGQYADSISTSGKGPRILLIATSNNPYTDRNSDTNYASAYSQLWIHGFTDTIFTGSVNNWYQDSMAGGSYNPSGYSQGKWAMSDIYKGSNAGVKLDGLDFDMIDITTSSTYSDPGVPSRSIEVQALPITSSQINSQSMGYADSKMSYTNIDAYLGGRNGFVYHYINLDKGIDKQDKIYY